MWNSIASVPFRCLFIYFADKQDIHEISDEFETGPQCAISFEGTCPDKNPYLTILVLWTSGERSLPIGYLFLFFFVSGLGCGL